MCAVIDSMGQKLIKLLEQHIWVFVNQYQGTVGFS